MGVALFLPWLQWICGKWQSWHFGQASMMITLIIKLFPSITKCCNMQQRTCCQQSHGTCLEDVTPCSSWENAGLLTMQLTCTTCVHAWIHSSILNWQSKNWITATNLLDWRTVVLKGNVTMSAPVQHHLLQQHACPFLHGPLILVQISRQSSPSGEQGLSFFCMSHACCKQQSTTMHAVKRQNRC